MRTALVVPQVPHPMVLPRQTTGGSGSMRFAVEPLSPNMLVMPPPSYPGPPTPTKSTMTQEVYSTPSKSASTQEPQRPPQEPQWYPQEPQRYPQEPSRPDTPRAPGTHELPLQMTPVGSPSHEKSSGDLATLRGEVEMLQAQLKSVFDMLQDQGHALAMEAQERSQLAKLLQCEREGHAQDVQELREQLESERSARAQERMELAEALQQEVDARTSDMRQLARSLQSECNARAGEVEQLAKVFQSEREVRIQETEELADTLRVEFANSGVAHRGESGHRAAGGDVELGRAPNSSRSETAELARRLNDLTHFVMAEHDSHNRVLEELRHCQQAAGGLHQAAS